MARKKQSEDDLGQDPAPQAVPKKRWKTVLYWTAVASVWMVIFGFFFTLYLTHDLPNVDELPRPALQQQTRILDSKGNILATYGAFYGDELRYDQIPPLMVQALLSVEDHRFFEHGPIDWLGFGRAVFTNVTAGRVVQGGSTITQQLAKNIYLSNQRSWKRKAQEFFLAYYLESKFSKEQIIEQYMNRVYFGSGAYGVDAASRRYFNHPANSLSLQEAAVLAGLMKAPSRYAPTRNPQAAIERSHVVMAAMVREGVISEKTFAWAKETPPTFNRKAAGSNIRYFTDFVMDRLAQYEVPLSGTVEVHTTLSPTQQAAAETALTRAIKRHRAEFRVSQGALMAMRPDGAIQAMMGGADYIDSQFNRATQARRQPGSAFKPFVYLAGVRSGWQPDKILVDEPITIDDWSPRNFDGDYHGAMTIAEGMARSINTIAVKVQEHAGRQQVVDIAADFGLPDIEPLPSTALGTMQLSPLELIGAYGPFANGGRRAEPYAIVEARTLSGELLYRHVPVAGKSVMTAREAKTMAEMLSRVVEGGSGKVAQLDRPAGGKTGTSQDFRDAWFVGFSHDMVAGVWLGNDDGSPMKRITGGGLPALIWRDFMMAAHAGVPAQALQASQ